MKHALLASFVLIAGLAIDQAAPATTIRPGEIWNDTSGKPINAHGGGVLFHQGVYYWYGEVKEGRTYVPACNDSWGGTRVVAGGVSCYSSTNLRTGKTKASCCLPWPMTRATTCIATKSSSARR